MGADLGVNSGKKKWSNIGIVKGADQPDQEAALLESHREKCDTRFNGTVRLDYHEGNLKTIRAEAITHDLRKKNIRR